MRLIFFITSQPPPISSGTSSASPMRVVPWQLLIEPPYFSDTLASSVLNLIQPAQLSSLSCSSQIPMSISAR